MFLFDPKLDEVYVGNIIKTYVSSNICFRFDPTLSLFTITGCQNHDKGGGDGNNMGNKAEPLYIV